MNIANYLAGGAEKAGDVPALVHGGRCITYPTLIDRVARLASGLASLGLRRGDRVVLLLPGRQTSLTAWVSS